MTFSPERAYRLADQVALRPEPFGALAYHYGTRHLNFLNSSDLRRVVECLNDHPSANSALESCGINEQRWPSFVAALTSLAASGFLEPTEAVEGLRQGLDQPGLRQGELPSSCCECSRRNMDVQQAPLTATWCRQCGSHRDLVRQGSQQNESPLPCCECSRRNLDRQGPQQGLDQGCDNGHR